MNRALHRGIAWALIFFLGAGPLAPILRAQEVALAPGTPQYDAYVGEVRDRLGHREGLEQMYQRQAQRQAQMQGELQALQGMRAPAGVDPAQWNARMQQDQQGLQQHVTQNQQLLQRTQQKLQPLYVKLQEDQERIKRSGNQALQDQIGVLIGVTGTKVVPIWSRLTAQDLGGMARYGAQQAHLRTVEWRIPKYENIATNAGNRVINAETRMSELPTIEWKPKPNAAGTHMELVAHDASLQTPIEGRKPIETSIPAKITNANGQVVDNPNAMRAGMDLAQLQNTNSQIGFKIQELKLKASRAVNAPQRDFFQKHADALTEKQTALKADIAKYQAENPSVGSRAAGLAKDAGKWALMSVGVTAGANVVTQLAQNGWDPTKVNYRQAVSFLGEKSFWGGTAGSFVGAMAGNVIASAIPGGQFVKILLNVGGAAAGWTIGSGNAGKADWIGIGVTTVGSTIGMLLGAAGGPLGVFLGGLAGQLISQFIYDKLKDWLIQNPEAISATSTGGLPVTLNPGQQQVPTGGYTGPSPTQTGYGGSTPVGPPPMQATDGPGTLADAESRMRQAYNDAQAAAARGDQQLNMIKMQEYQNIRAWIQSKRQQLGTAGPEDERTR